jgi:hypothetical protein
MAEGQGEAEIDRQSGLGYQFNHVDTILRRVFGEG